MFSKGNLNLDLAGILFAQAYRHVQQGTKVFPLLKTELTRHQQVLDSWSDSLTGDERENRLTEIVHSLSALEDKYAPVVTNYAIACVLLVNSAEAFINDVAYLCLARGAADQFDKMSPVGKWLFLPKIVGLSFSPDLGKHPMSEFAALVKLRNLLIHAKPMKQTGIWKMPVFLNDMNMNPDRMTRATQSVCDLIREFSESWKGSVGPDWLYTKSEGYLDPCFYLGIAEVRMRLGRAGEEHA
jgi:hypothetical protein